MCTRQGRNRKREALPLSLVFNVLHRLLQLLRGGLLSPDALHNSTYNKDKNIYTSCLWMQGNGRAQLYECHLQKVCHQNQAAFRFMQPAWCCACAGPPAACCCWRSWGSCCSCCCRSCCCCACPGAAPACCCCCACPAAAAPACCCRGVSCTSAAEAQLQGNRGGHAPCTKGHGSCVTGLRQGHIGGHCWSILSRHM